jgi:hypothetical protein
MGGGGGGWKNCIHSVSLGYVLFLYTKEGVGHNQKAKGQLWAAITDVDQARQDRKQATSSSLFGIADMSTTWRLRVTAPGWHCVQMPWGHGGWSLHPSFIVHRSSAATIDKPHPIRLQNHIPCGTFCTRYGPRKRRNGNIGPLHGTGSREAACPFHHRKTSLNLTWVLKIPNSVQNTQTFAPI